ncbi:MAG: hypothetical protein HYZ27_09015 [Deltaproteobacteria bacterium]|nr:hypothetical protein [Deltaproteobacteria bacterium]
MDAWEAVVDPFSFPRHVEIGYEVRVAGSFDIPNNRTIPVVFVLRQGAQFAVQ